MVSLLRQFTPKPYSAEFLMNYETSYSNLRLDFKFGQIFALLHRVFRSCSNFEVYQQELINLKLIFRNKGYLNSFTDLYVKNQVTFL